MEYVTLDSDDEDIIVPPSPSQSIVTVPVNDTGAGLRSRLNDVPGVAGGAMAPPDSARSVKVNPISTREGRLCLPNNTGTPEISDLPTTALGKTYLMRKRARK